MNLRERFKEPGAIVPALCLAASAAMANSSFDWTGENGVVTIPAGIAAEVLDEDIPAVQALTSIVQADATSQIVFRNASALTLSASITGPGGGGSSRPNVVMDAASQVTFNGNVSFSSSANANTHITLGNCTVNGAIGQDRNYYYVTALPGCTVRYSSSAQVARLYAGYFYGPGTHRFACRVPSGNGTFTECHIGSAHVVFEPGAQPKVECWRTSSDDSAVIDLGGVDMTTKSIFGGSMSASSSPKVIEVTSEGAAAVTFDMTEDHRAARDQSCSVAYTGAVSLNVANGDAYTYRLMNGVSTTTGDLNISGGTFALDGCSQWKGRRVSVTGGRLLANSSVGSLSPDADLSVSGHGVVEVPSGKVLSVKSLTVGGVTVAIGGSVSVSGLASAYPGFFAGSGTVTTLKPFLYVDDAGGSDLNDGRSAATAYKTIKKALEEAVSGDTVYVAPGVYGDEAGDGVMGSAGDYSRVVVPAGVRLVSTGCAANTLIVGKAATAPKADPHGNSLSGTDSARCVWLSANSRIEGFTLTGGRATFDSAAKTGGGVYAADMTTCRIVGCVVSNCYAAATGSAGEGGMYLRCRISDNNRGGANYGYGLRNAKAYNCFFVDQADGMSGCHDTYYCTFYKARNTRGRQVHGGNGPFVGCVFMSDDAPGLTASCAVRNTICVKLPTSGVVDGSCAEKTWDEIGIAETGAPTSRSVAVGFGDVWADYLALMTAAGWTEEEASRDFAGNPRRVDGKVAAGCREYDAASELATSEWFVNDATGSDSNNGRNALTPFRTIKAALERASDGETVWVYPGVYGDEPGDEVMGELVYKSGSSTQLDAPFGYSRIVIPAGVAVRSTGGRESTVIVGRKATTPLSGGGCGGDSARCAYVSANAKLVGFTLAGGYSTTVTDTAEEASGATFGGGFCTPGSGSGEIVDCIVSNNVASATGGTGHGGACFGCVFSDNDAVQTYGKGVRYSRLYNCLLKNSRELRGMSSACDAIVNCTFINPYSGAAAVHAYADKDVVNSVFVTAAAPEDIGIGLYRSCLFTRAPANPANRDVTSDVKTESELALDEGVPSAKTSAVVGAGDMALYSAALADYPEWAAVDALSGQRIYNRALDIGAVEYDWRKAYRADLGGRRWLAVEAASANAVETAAGAVRLADGASISLTVAIDEDGSSAFAVIPFAASGAGTLAATLDGEAISPDGGTFAVPSVAGRHELKFSWSGDGYADFTKMRRQRGLLLICR